jgi:hypothetical protein
MKSLILILLCAARCFAVAPTAICTQDNGGSAVATAACTGTVTAGALLIVSLEGLNTSVTGMTVTDGQGNSYVLARGITGGAVTDCIVTFSAPCLVSFYTSSVASAGSLTVTANWTTATTNTRIYVTQWTGSGPLSFDGANYGSDTTAGPSDSGASSGNSGHPGDLVFGFCESNTTTSSPGTSFTQLDNSITAILTEYRLGAGNLHATCALGASSPWQAQVLTFRAAYFVSTSGSDTNAGDSRSVPWQHAPGMKNCASTCAGHTPAAGEQFIFRGGDTWGFSTGTVGLPWDWGAWSGTSGNSIYIGVDPTYFTGGSWARPKFSGNNPLSGSAVGSCPNNFVTGGPPPEAHSYLLTIAGNYTTFDNFDMLGFCTAVPVGTGGNYASYVLAGVSGATTTTIQNFYFHGWTHTAAVNDQAMIVNTDNGSGTGDAIMLNDVVDGSDSDGTSFQVTGGGPTTWIGNYIGNIGSGLVDGGIHLFHDNLLEHVGPSYTSGKHTNMFYVTSGPSNGTIVYNNIFRHIPDAQTVVIQIDPCNGGTDLFYNNLVYDTPGSNVVNIAVNDVCAAWSGSSFKMFNNTVQSGAGPCTSIGKPGTSSPSFASQIVENNHCINDAGVVYTTSLGTNPTSTTNTLQTTAAATAAGYTSSQTYAYSPTSAGSTTVGVGTDLTASCSGDLAVLCNDTTYGATYNATTHVVTTGARTANPRPSSGAWDTGAYEFAGGSNNGGSASGGNSVMGGKSVN